MRNSGLPTPLGLGVNPPYTFWSSRIPSKEAIMLKIKGKRHGKHVIPSIDGTARKLAGDSIGLSIRGSWSPKKPRSQSSKHSHPLLHKEPKRHKRKVEDVEAEDEEDELIVWHDGLDARPRTSNCSLNHRCSYSPVEFVALHSSLTSTDITATSYRPPTALANP